MKVWTNARGGAIHAVKRKGEARGQKEELQKQGEKSVSLEEDIKFDVDNAAYT